jgi:ArsR family transcriptional regulator, lead/cadmium/zinc/bismuth-responsive transcriptional repressor
VVVVEIDAGARRRDQKQPEQDTVEPGEPDREPGGLGHTAMLACRPAGGGRGHPNCVVAGRHESRYHLHDHADVQISQERASMSTAEAEPTGLGPAEVAPLDGCVVRMVDPVRVADTRRRLLDVDEAEQLGGLFRLLGDRNRVRILFALAEAGELCVCDLAAAVDVAEPAVSQALRLLRTAGVVRSRRDGRTVWYRLDDEHVRLLLDLSRTHLSHGS